MARRQCLRGVNIHAVPGSRGTCRSSNDRRGLVREGILDAGSQLDRRLRSAVESAGEWRHRGRRA